MRLRFTRIPPAVWPVGCGISAYIGARYAAGIAAAAWAALALVAMVYALGYATLTRYRFRLEAAALEREIGDERAALSMGRRARWVLLTVADRDGTLYQQTLAQVLTDVTPEGRTMVWDEPAAALLYYAEPHEMGDTDGRPE